MCSEALYFGPRLMSRAPGFYALERSSHPVFHITSSVKSGQDMLLRLHPSSSRMQGIGSTHRLRSIVKAMVPASSGCTNPSAMDLSVELPLEV